MEAEAPDRNLGFDIHTARPAQSSPVRRRAASDGIDVLTKSKGSEAMSLKTEREKHEKELEELQQANAERRMAYARPRFTGSFRRSAMRRPVSRSPRRSARFTRSAARCISRSPASSPAMTP
jgi:hypothetical protein